MIHLFWLLMVITIDGVFGMKCSYPTLPLHAVPFSIQNAKHFSENDKFYYKCDTGYHFQGTEVVKHKVQCKSGEWQPATMEKCVDNCDNRCSENGDCRKTIGGYVCVCKKNIAGPHCEFEVCESPPTYQNVKQVLKKGRLMDGFYSLKAVVSLECKQGFRLVNHTAITTTCGVNGRWSHTIQPVCERPYCKIPSFLSPLLDYTPKLKRYEQSWSVQLSCPNGYKLQQSAHGGSLNTIICNSDGKFPPTSYWPTCQSQNCPDPPFIGNAIKEVRPYHIGEKVRYSCRAGYYLVGQSDLVCSPLLQWSGLKPKCYSVHEFSSYCIRQGKQMVAINGHYVCGSGVPTTHLTVQRIDGSSSTKPLTIVTATAGGLLLLLLMVISLVACQRRRIARIRRHGRQRMNSDDDRYSFVYYSNDVHVVLPSYDEAINGVRRSEPPPYVGEESANTPSNVAAVSNLSSRQENEYEVIDEVPLQREGSVSATPISQRRTSASSSGEEPIYASIQRVLSGSTIHHSLEENASLHTVNSQEETVSVATTQEDNISTNNLYPTEENLVKSLDPDRQSLQSSSSSDTCDDNVPLIEN